MLTELYRYALSKNLAAVPGFKPKKIKGYVSLSGEGAFLDIVPAPKEAVFCPDIGSAANGTRFCNPLVEKACIPLCMVLDPVKDKNTPTKHAFFLSMLESGAEAEPLFGAARRALSDETTRTRIADALSENKYKPSDPIGFIVDGTPLEQSARYLDWWGEFRRQFIPSGPEILPRCLITGELAPALATVPKVSGLYNVGGHTSGDAFLCFDKDAFQSYGLKQSANAPVSEEAMAAVNAALTKLIAEAQVLGGAKLVHWYSGPVGPGEDLIPLLFGDNFPMDEDDADASDERDALVAARKLVESVREGQVPQALSMRYFIMPLSGASGRMMVRGWYEGSYEELYKNVSAWYEDLRIVSPYGRSATRPPKLKALCTRLLKPGGDAKKIWERMDKELSGLTGQLLCAIVQGAALPDAVASRALSWLRSNMCARDEQEGDRGPRAESMAYQLLKAWLRRRQKTQEGTVLMEQEVNTGYPGVAYHCGRLMAVYAAIQADALGPDLGAGVLQRYYASASSAPRLVIGKLSALSQHHLAKLEGRGKVIRYERMLSEIAGQIGRRQIPASLSLEEQTEFALGYYQQRAAIFTPAEKKTEEETQNGH